MCSLSVGSVDNMAFYVEKKKQKHNQHCIVTFSQNDLIIFESTYVHISS